MISCISILKVRNNKFIFSYKYQFSAKYITSLYHYHNKKTQLKNSTSTPVAQAANMTSQGALVIVHYCLNVLKRLQKVRKINYKDIPSTTARVRTFPILEICFTLFLYDLNLFKATSSSKSCKISNAMLIKQ